MTERPIIFSGPMVRAILDRKKTQTRRVVNADKVGPSVWSHDSIGGWRQQGSEWSARAGECNVYSRPVGCPYGMPGDQLWVREILQRFNGQPKPTAQYRADITGVVGRNSPHGAAANGAALWWSERAVVPSIHMPRWACRLTLEVTAVRVERLQEISGKDIEAEGAVLRPHYIEGLEGPNPVSAFDGKVYLDLKSLWAAGWDSINTKRGYSWESNPWVWVIEFKVAQ